MRHGRLTLASFRATHVILTVLLVFSAVVGAITIPAPALAGDDNVGKFLLNTTIDTAYCQYRVGLPGQDTRIRLVVSPPQVRASAAWNRANFGEPQTIRWNATIYQRYADGRPKLAILSTTADTTATFTIYNTFSGGVSFIQKAYAVMEVQHTISWLGSGDEVLGQTTVVQPVFIFNGTSQIAADPADLCTAPNPPQMTALTSLRVTVNSSPRFRVKDARPFMNNDAGSTLEWGGVPIASSETFNIKGAEFENRVLVPAVPAGTYPLTVTRGDGKSATITYTVIPRIKITPTPAPRGSTVNVSLRGFAARTSVAIRWKRGSSFVTVATATTSGTGSANVMVTVPTWAPDGDQVVRAQAASGPNAQTSVFKVAGGPLTSAVIPKPTSTPTPSPSPTATATSTLVPSPSATPSPEPTATATSEPSPPSEATATAEATVAPTIESTPEPTVTLTAEPTVEATSPAATTEAVET